MKKLQFIKVMKAIYLKQTKLNYPPLKIHIEPTNICNFNCPNCPTNKIHLNRRGFMSMDLFKKIASEPFIKNSTINLFLFGEPLLHPKINEMIRILKEKNINTNTYTNGSLLSREMCSKLLNLDTIHISLHKPESTIPKIINLMKFIKESKSNLKVYVESLDIPSEKLTKEQIDSLKKQGIKYSIKQLHDWIGRFPLEHNSKIYVCPHPFLMINICWDGKVNPCCRDCNRKLIVGDVNKHTLEELWNGEKIRELRKSLLNKKRNACYPCEKLFQPILNFKRIITALKRKLS